MIITYYQPPMDLPSMGLMISKGRLMAVDWVKDAKQFCAKFPQATLMPTNQLEGLDDNQQTALQALKQFDEYFVGKRQIFTMPLGLLEGTPFQQQVWHALAQIPYGQTISYAKLAQNVGKPKAFRACANANGKNPLSIVIPCHRVIASDGGIGGYTGGVSIKKTLLALEGVVHW